jgi:hypothetical protein
MKSHIRKSKASGSTKRRIFEIHNGIGRYSPRRLAREEQARIELSFKKGLL